MLKLIDNLLKKVDVKVETQRCSWIGDKSERHRLKIFPWRPFLDWVFRIVKSVQTVTGSILKLYFTCTVLADGWRINIDVSTLSINNDLWSRRYGSSSCVELSNSVKRNWIYLETERRGILWSICIIGWIWWSGYEKKNLHIRLHGSKYPDCSYFLSSLLPLTLACEIR